MRKGEYHSFKQLVDRIFYENSKKQTTLLIGIDGCGGSGKSTFAAKIITDFPKVTIVHLDDFYLPSSKLMNIEPTKKPVGADYDWQRVLKQVLEPLSQEVEGYYQRYDWETDQLAEWHAVPTGGIVIIEGVYALRKELVEIYDLKIWVDCPRETRLARGLERDGEDARAMWENNWMVSEDIYVEQHKPIDRADLIIKGTVSIESSS